MGDPRGLDDPGVAHRLAPPPRPPTVYPPFHVSTMRLIGAASIPHALAYALKWQLELRDERLPGARKELAEKLIEIWQFLKEMEAEAPRDFDGALLVRDPLAVFAGAKIKTRLVAISTGEEILVETSREEARLPAWQPTLFPPDLPRDVRARYPARPTQVEQIPPFSDAVIQQWILTSLLTNEDEELEEDQQDTPPPPPPAEEPAETFSVNLPVEKEPPGPDSNNAEKALEDAARKAERSRWSAERLNAFKGVTPTVNAAIARLRSTNLGDIKRHTGVQFDSAYLDVPLFNNTEFILYHSVCTFLLDKNGEPTDLRLRREGQGMFDYPILIESPGETVRRDVPAPGGINVSVQRYGHGLFRLDDNGIHKLIQGTVGGFTLEQVTENVPHWIQTRLQTHLDRSGKYAFVAGLTVAAAHPAAREEITLSRIRDRIPEFVDTVTPYLVEELIKRASYKLENWEAFAKEVLKSLIQELIVAEVRGKIRDYLIKKVGKRIVPGVNAVMAVKDLATGGQERMRIRNIIACMMVALKSNSDEDMHIAAKTCSKVVADEFQDAAMKALIKQSQKAKAKLSTKSKEKRDADERAEQAKPKPKPESESDAGDKAKIARQDAPDKTGNPRDPTGKPVDVPLSNKTQVPDAESKPTVKPPTKKEQREIDRWPDAVEKHKERLRKREEQQAKKEAEKKQKEEDKKKKAENDEKEARGTSKESKGLESKGVDTDKRSNGSSIKGTPMKPQPEVPRHKQPLDPNDPEVLKKRKVIDKEPDPPPPPRHVDEPKGRPEGTDNVRPTANVRTGAHSDEAILRKQNEQVGGARPLGHDEHHNAPKRGGDQAGEDMRDSLSTTGVSKNDAANGTPARGLPRDPRAPLESSSQHWGLHRKDDWEALRRQLATAKGDPKGIRDALKSHGLDIAEGRKIKLPDFWLGPDPDPPPKRPGGAARKKAK